MSDRRPPQESARCRWPQRRAQFPPEVVAQCHAVVRRLLQQASQETITTTVHSDGSGKILSTKTERKKTPPRPAEINSWLRIFRQLDELGLLPDLRRGTPNDLEGALAAAAGSAVGQALILLGSRLSSDIPSESTCAAQRSGGMVRRAPQAMAYGMQPAKAADASPEKQRAKFAYRSPPPAAGSAGKTPPNWGLRSDFASVETYDPWREPTSIASHDVSATCDGLNSSASDASLEQRSLKTPFKLVGRPAEGGSVAGRFCVRAKGENSGQKRELSESDKR